MGSLQFGQVLMQEAITATAAGTTTLVNTSKQMQIFTGSSAQTVVLPDATTMSAGQWFEIYNQSSSALTLHFNGGAAFTDAAGTSYSNIAAHSSITVKLQTNGTAAGTWAVESPPASVGIITSSNVNTATFTAPTVQKFLSGSGTYTLPTSPRTPLYIRVKMVGGGGGGCGAPAGTGGNSGSSSTFGSSFLTAGPGTGGGQVSGIQGAGLGGTNTITGSPLIVANVTGGSGDFGGYGATGMTDSKGGLGGASFYGGGGSGGGAAGNGGTAVAYGSGGGGGSSSTVSGGGGGAGGYVEVLITSSISSTYSYSVGSGGASNGGAAGNGGPGATGYVEVEEYYQ